MQVKESNVNLRLLLNAAGVKAQWPRAANALRRRAAQAHPAFE